MNKQRALVVDRDGTLASVAYCAPTDQNNVSWMSYNAALPFDAVVPSVLQMVIDWKAANPTGAVVMVSGRAAGDYKGDIRRFHLMWAWINKHYLPIDRLFMRRGGDQRRDSIVKQEILDQHLRPQFDIDYVIDDRQQVVDMWRANGLTVVQVIDPGIPPGIATQWKDQQ